MKRGCYTLLGVLFVAFAGRAVGRAPAVGHWQLAAASDGRYTYVATVNRRGQVFGEFCSFKSFSCRWLLAVHVPCRFGDVYPVLANSSAGANPIAIFCLGPMGGHRYAMALMNRKRLEASIAHAGRVVFAAPIEGGGFAMATFRLTGRAQAAARLHQYLIAQARRRRTRLAESPL